MILSNIAEFINVGQIMTRVEAKEGAAEPVIGELQVLMPKAIAAGKIDINEFNTVKLKQPIDGKKLTRVGDIIVKLSTPYDTALVEEESSGVAYNSFCAIIRGLNTEKVDANFLVAYLNTNYVKETLRIKAGVTTLPVIKIKNIREMEIPEIPLEIQNMLGEAYRVSANKLEILRKLQQNEKKIMNSMILTEIRRAKSGEE